MKGWSPLIVCLIPIKWRGVFPSVLLKEKWKVNIIKWSLQVNDPKHDLKTTHIYSIKWLIHINREYNMMRKLTPMKTRCFLSIECNHFISKLLFILCSYSSIISFRFGSLYMYIIGMSPHSTYTSSYNIWQRPWIHLIGSRM